MKKIPAPQLLGQTTEHLASFGEEGLLVHRELLPALRDLIEDTAQAGINLGIASGFRSFERQLAIWNGKARGERLVLDDYGVPIDINRLDDREKLWAILRWSALPGASRHHWGTDLDVWDSAAVSADYPLQLTAAEYASDGPFARLADWLERNLTSESAFFRPYAIDDKGVAPEPWHLSFKPLADDFARQLTIPLIAAALEQADICLKKVILEHLEEIFARYILC